MKFRNFGKKSLSEIDLLMEGMGLSFGIDVTKYNIEKKVLKYETQKES
jgi:DNA-directed RNA polymerase subunit alpha